MAVLGQRQSAQSLSLPPPSADTRLRNGFLMGKIVFAAIFICMGDIAAAIYLLVIGDLNILSLLIG